MPTPESIELSQAKEALVRSGYLLESRVETALWKAGYYVEANAAYPDPDTGKSREIDIYALNAFHAGPLDTDFIFSVLLVECVNNPQPLALIAKDPLVGFLHIEEVKHAGLPVKFLTKGADKSWVGLPDYLGLDKFHHYCKGRIATQYCSFQRKKDQQKQEWMAFHDQPHFESLGKLCDAVDHFVDKHFKSWEFDGPESVNIEFYYPLLVLQGGLLEVRPTKGSVRLLECKHLQLRRNTFRGGEERTYQIDVITERYLMRYLRLVQSEMEKTSRLLRRRHREVREAIDRIVARARRMRSPEKRRKAMES